MVKIAYVKFSGEEHVVDVAPGHSVMEGAVKNNIPGIDNGLIVRMPESQH